MKEQHYIVVTGASRGIGYATARAFAERPGTVVMGVARSQQGLNALVESCSDLPGDVITLTHDISEWSGNLSAEIRRSVPRVDVLVNNAGHLIHKPFTDLTEKDIDLMYRSNYKAHFHLIQELLPLMPHGSHIVNISSMGGVQGSVKFNGLSAYSAMKGALAVLTETLAMEFEPLGIRVNCLAPGSVQTEMLTRAFPGYEAPVQPKEMGAFIADFALSKGSLFNGKILPVSLSTP